jgi:hypothetical protein
LSCSAPATISEALALYVSTSTTIGSGRRRRRQIPQA